MLKKFLIFLSLFVLLVAGLFVQIIIDENIVNPSDFFKTDDEKDLQYKERHTLAKEIVESTSEILKEKLYSIDRKHTNKEISSYNILYSINNKNIFLALHTSHIDKNEIPNIKNVYDKTQWLVDTILKNDPHPSSENSEDKKDIRDSSWYGSVSLKKLNQTHSLILVTFSKNNLDKALKNSSFKKDYQKYMSNIINHEYIHLLGEDEYLAAKYGESIPIDTSSKFLADISNENYILKVYDKYFTYEKYNSFIDNLSIEIPLNKQDKIRVQNMIETIKENKDNILLFDEKFKNAQIGTAKRAFWSRNHNRTFVEEYYNILSAGEYFFDLHIFGLTQEYRSKITAGEYFNMYHILKENAYSEEDVKLFNKSILNQILTFKYGNLKTNKSPQIQAQVLYSLNNLTSICFKPEILDDSLANGIMYLRGNLVQNNINKAKEYLQKASSLGSLKAKELLASIYAKEHKYKQAIALYQETASYNEIGWIYYTAEDDTRNYQKAFEYFNKALKTTKLMAMSNLGLMYTRGQYVEQDYKKAKELFENALEIYRAPAVINNLAWLYLNGLGVEQNTTKALQLFNEAAQQHSIAAILNLAAIYKEHKFVNEDSDTLKYWETQVKKLAQEEIDYNYELGR